MATVLSNYVLYSDVPQRNYRQIAAKREYNGSFFIQVWEGTVIDVSPFDHINPDAEIVFCGSADEARAEAAKERETSLAQGWRDYNRTQE